MKTYLVSLIILTIVVAGCGKKASSEDEEGRSVKAMVEVKATPLRRGDMAIVVQAVGKVDALRKQKLFSPVAGKVTSLTVLEGTAVHAGDVLAVIQTKESQAAISGAEALVRSAKTNEEKSEAVRALELAKSSANSVSIRATDGGTVSTRSVSEGEFVAENAELFTVIDLSTLVFVADVPARDLSSLVLGQHCSISLQTIPGKSLPGEVEAINPQSDMMSQTVKVRVKFSSLSSGSRDLLKTDMIGTARIVTGNRKGVFIVPKVALLRNDEANTYTVVSFGSDSVAFSVPVQVIGMTDSTASISNHSLKEGMNIIIEGHYALADSTRITVVQ
jgi:multidrug efflux pump subunit AcrA (membrane-fusion protein)